MSGECDSISIEKVPMLSRYVNGSSCRCRSRHAFGLSDRECQQCFDAQGVCSDMDDGLLGGGNCGFTQSSTTSKELYENVVQREHACMYGPAGILFHPLPNNSSSCS